jgi:transcriptional regulator with XRE-family HTH domain
MNNINTYEEWEIEVGRQLRELRLRQNMDQRELAARAGIALNAVKNIEAGRGSTLSSLIKTLRVLERTDWLLKLAPPVSISPLQMLKAKPVRKRAFKSRRQSDV